jgi:hypothetical protein
VAWTEEEFHRDDASHVLGVVAHDVEDNDWAWAALGRDEQGDFRAIANEVSLPTREAARADLIRLMEAAEARGAVVFPRDAEGDGTPSTHGWRIEGIGRTPRRRSVRLVALLMLVIFLLFLFLRGRLW